jgi:site-specific recombinase XerD
MAQQRPRYAPEEENAEMLKRFRLWLTSQNYVPNTVEKYCGICKRFCSSLGRKALRTVTPLDICDFVTSNIVPGSSDGVVQGKLVALRSFFDFLYMGGVVDAVPPRFIRPRRVTKLLPRALTVDQVRVLLDKTTKLRHGKQGNGSR